MLDFNRLFEEFYDGIKKELKIFSDSIENKDVYAFAFSIDHNCGQLELLYQNNGRFERELKSYKKNNRLYGWKVYGMDGAQYSTGEFGLISTSFTRSAYVKHFLDSCAYYAAGYYFGEEQPLSGDYTMHGNINGKFEEDYQTLMRLLASMAIDELTDDLPKLGINTTNNCILFYL